MLARFHHSSGLLKVNMVRSTNVDNVDALVFGKLVERGVGVVETQSLARFSGTLGGAAQNSLYPDSASPQGFEMRPSDETQSNDCCP
jgi:hypothetical protein